MYSRVYVEITNICNMSCSFCHGHSRAKKRMSESEFVKVLEELEGKTKHIYYHLMGEPLTHPELPKFVRLAGERGFRSLITTNGTLLDKVGDKLLESGIYKINISLHSFEEQDKEYFKRYMQDVVDFVDKAKDYKTIVVLRLWNGGGKNEENDGTLNFLRDHIDGEWTETERGIKVRNRLHLEWGERFIWPDLNEEEGSPDLFCYGMRDHFGILVDGSVVPCCLDSEGIITLGNLFEEPLVNILNSTRAKALKHGFGVRQATEELCRKCAYARRF